MWYWELYRKMHGQNLAFGYSNKVNSERKTYKLIGLTSVAISVMVVVMNLNPLFYNEAVQIGLVILGAIAVQVFSRHAIERLVQQVVRANRYESRAEEKKREDTVISIFHTAFALVIWAIAAFTILGLLRVNLAGLLTGAGIFGVIFGISAQNTIRNYMAGVAILIENQYRVGDVIRLNGGLLGGNVVAEGVVEDITLRVTKLRDLEGRLLIVRNGDAGIIENRTFAHANVVIDITVPYDSDLEKIERLVNHVGTEMLTSEEMNKCITKPIGFLYVDNFTDSGVVVRARGTVKPGSQWKVAGEFRRLLKVEADKQKLKLGASSL